MSPTRAASPRPLTLSLESARQQLHGWVTLAADNDVFVTKQIARLPVQLRQQHLELWSRSNAINSERERERARVIGEANEAAIRPDDPSSETAFKAIGSPRRHLIPHDHSSGMGSPRSRYFELMRPESGSEVRRQSGFAYGGVFPGKRDMRGPPTESHEVRFSIGVTGSYLLYVSLRQPHTVSDSGKTKSSASLEDWQVSGSPFVITVAPGNAYPLSTNLTPKLNDQLRGVRDAGDEERYTCEILLATRDKMGNLCDRGKANVTCGFLGVSAQAGPPADGGEASADLAEPVVEKQSSGVEDLGNGTYKLKWTTITPGAFTVYVKIDGLHVIGSPARLVMMTSAPEKPIPRERERKKSQAPAVLS